MTGFEVSLEMDSRCSLRDYTKFIRYVMLLDEKYCEDWVEYDCSGHIKLHNMSQAVMRKLLMLFVSLRASEDRDVKILSVTKDDLIWIPDSAGHRKLIEVLFKTEKCRNGFIEYNRRTTENEVWDRFKQAMVRT